MLFRYIAVRFLKSTIDDGGQRTLVQTTHIRGAWLVPVVEDGEQKSHRVFTARFGRSAANVRATVCPGGTAHACDDAESGRGNDR